MRTDLIVLGRLLGTFTEWDHAEEREDIFDNFEPAEGVDLGACHSLYINYETGQIAMQDAQGNVLATGDVALLCAALPRR